MIPARISPTTAGWQESEQRANRARRHDHDRQREQHVEHLVHRRARDMQAEDLAAERRRRSGELFAVGPDD